MFRPVLSAALCAGVCACSASPPPTAVVPATEATAPASTLDAAPAPTFNDPPAVHGMLLVGDQMTYASHLPMFHQPHDYQVIVRVSLGDDALRTYRADRKAHPTAIYTLAPKPFKLPDLRKRWKTPFGFTATVYRGHFERGGTPIIADLGVAVVGVVHFRRLDANMVKPSEFRALLFGEANEWFVAHYIAGKPDFDQLATVRGSGALHAGPIAVGKRPHSKRLSDGETLRGTYLERPVAAVQLRVDSVLYTEVDELSR